MPALRTYSGHFLYRWLTALCLVLAGVFLWQLVASWDWGELLFLVIAAWSAVRCIILMSSKIEIMPDRLRVRVPMRPAREIAFRQLSEVYEEGRGLRSILLLYYPRTSDGIITTDEAVSMALPAVNGHDELLAALRAQVLA